MKRQSDPVISSTSKCAVILPIYNEALHLPRVLASLFDQLPESCIVVAVDDASTDNSLEVLRKTALTDSRLQVVAQAQNQGPSAARNAGVKATDAELLFFIDGDGLLCDGALQFLLTALLSAPKHLGCNGIIALEQGADLTSTFVTASLHHQLRQHGKSVETAFTALCLLKRAAWEQMGGWDESKRSRYADDVATRWSLPAESIMQVFAAQVRHQKRVQPIGLFKHRMNIGHHFVHSLRAAPKGNRARRAIIDRRYPINTLLMVMTPVNLVPGIGVGWAYFFYRNNKAFLNCFAKEYGRLRAAQAIPLLWLEGAGYALGILRGALTSLGAQNGIADET